MVDKSNKSEIPANNVYELKKHPGWKSREEKPSSLFYKHGEEIQKLAPTSYFFSLIPEIGERMKGLRTGRSIDWTGKLSNSEGNFMVHVNYTKTETKVKVYKISNDKQRILQHYVALEEKAPGILRMAFKGTKPGESEDKHVAFFHYEGSLGDRSEPRKVFNKDITVINTVAGSEEEQASLQSLAFVRDTIAFATPVKEPLEYLRMPVIN